jgi:hypothetical protein
VSVILAIDPGYTESAWLLYDAELGTPMEWAKEDNQRVRRLIAESPARTLAIEMVASYGMAVGREVFETCVWAGRFIELFAGGTGGDVLRIYRADVKLHLCNSRRAKDKNVRQALIDLYGPTKEAAIGRKASPGPLYGLAGDGWAALGVAVTAAAKYRDNVVQLKEVKGA